MCKQYDRQWTTAAAREREREIKERTSGDLLSIKTHTHIGAGKDETRVGDHRGEHVGKSLGKHGERLSENLWLGSCCEVMSTLLEINSTGPLSPHGHELTPDEFKRTN